MTANATANTQAAQPLLTIEDAATSWREAGRPFAEAIIVHATSGAPVPVGGRMLIAGEEDFLGSVSGGCVEADVIALALDVIADGRPRTATFGIDEERAWRAGLPCGATIRVLVARPSADETRTMSDAMARLRRERSPFAVATNLETGERAIFDDITAAPEPIAAALKSGQSTIVTSEDGETFLHVLLPPPRIVAIGATHIAQLLEVMAKAAGYDIVVIDPRSAFTSTSRFTAETAITGWPEEKLKRFTDDAYTAIVTLTHVGHIDDEALKIALRSDCRYVGALGSRRTHAARTRRLQEAGLSEAEIARIHAPVGLDLGGRAPGEIATAILAEIVAAFNQGTKA